MWPTLLILCTGFLILLPLLPALHELVFKTDVNPLPIEHTLKGEVGFFADSFRVRVQGWLNVEEPASAKLRVLTASMPGADALTGQDTGAECLALACPDARLPGGIALERELYAAGDLFVEEGVSLRAVLAEATLTFEPRCTVQRWADAASIRAADRCVFHGRISARKCIEFGGDTQFERVSAPSILLGPMQATTLFAPPCELDPLPPADRFHPLANRSTYWGALHPERAVHHAGDLVVQSAASFPAGSRIEGSIKTHGDLALRPHVHVRGQVVARGAITLAAHGRIEGNIMSETSIHLASGCVVGSEEQPVSISAPHITVEPGVRVHGSLSAYEGGRIV